MDKQDANNNQRPEQQSQEENELDIAFIADESKQPASDFLSFSEDRSMSAVSFLNTPNYTAFSIPDPQISGLQSWPQESIEPFRVCPKRNASIREENESYEEEEPTEKYTKKRINEKMKIVNIKQAPGQNGGSMSSALSNYNSYCLRRKKKEVSYNQNSSGEESERNQLRFLVSEIQERPITRSFKKMQGPKDPS